MPTVVGVSFRPVTKIYHFDPGAMLDLESGEFVVVETSQGQEIGQVAWSARAMGQERVANDLKPVLRRATPVDLIERDKNRRREPEALEICRERAEAHGLPMKVVSAEYSYDGSRLVVSFTSEGRVDFRDLVRDLARSLNARIEMKQIGVRDQAKVLDGIGKCGRQLCCSSWLREFNPVTIKMAKTQNLPLNPPEISGVCGRLLCCLSYEQDVYVDARKNLPKVGSTVKTPEGEGRVRRVNPLSETLTVKLTDGSMQEFAVTDLEGPPVSARRTGCGCAMKRSAAQAAGDTSSAQIDAGEDPDQAAGEGETRSRRSRRSRSRRRRRSSDQEQDQ
ncbi:MAG: stage 0 sporulation family protein [Caldilineae bacterium]|nr:stage 0 sporulation family protein [Anaerolineae bacterium]MCB0200613.1 stage 0 sporulation family protein [Anaerolineae bacterium]MCB0204751.1 stage 0 sporulation family protein [Anaerolineae bacterium]MCB0256565.1 stage 0 sporulation family protein [Anaerolineae bacterium]MCB9153244.1 stage 0 sporulation family protein [Caldilineae bacterium]